VASDHVLAGERRDISAVVSVCPAERTEISAGTETIRPYGARMSANHREITAPEDVRAVLNDPAFIVPPVPGDGSRGGIGWLRATVSRFSGGDTHSRRRSLATDELAKIDTDLLRRGALERTGSLLETHGGAIDVMAMVARVVPVELLAEAIGLPAGLSAHVKTIAQAYHPNVDVSPAADQAVTELIDACGGVTDEITAARIGLLVQACDATAGLAGNAVFAMLQGKIGSSSESTVVGALRRNPPVRITRRQAAATTRVGGDVVAGTFVTLDLTGGNLAFGAGPRKCPGSEHAIAIAAGIVEALRDRKLVRQDIEYEPSANLRVPVSLPVT
jgi:cytochrome P450